MRWGFALLFASAVFAQDPGKAPVPPSSPGLKFRLLTPPGGSTSKPRAYVVAPKQTITVRPEDGQAAAPTRAHPLCSIPLTNVFRQDLIPRMPTITPDPKPFASREVRLPAPPCDERTPPAAPRP
jgi:hypothetical protein